MSHKHKFIFVKPGKVAGSAIELGLEGKLEASAIVTPMSVFEPKCDEDAYEHIGRNCKGYSEHMAPAEIKRKAPGEWDSYTIISVCRNPFDMLISRWHWEGWIFQKYGEPGLHSYIAMFNKFKRDKNLSLVQLPRKLSINRARKMVAREYPKGNFDFFVRHLPDQWTNDQYYFDGKEVIPNIVLRYESLQSDFDELCKEYGLSQSQLPRVKSKIRPAGLDIKGYYAPELSEFVAKKFEKQMTAFGYSRF